MTETVETHHAPDRQPAPPRHGVEHLTKPGFVRAAWMTPLFWALGAGIVVFFRWLGDYEPTWDWIVVTVVGSMTTAPVGFLAGIGAGGASDRARAAAYVASLRVCVASARRISLFSRRPALSSYDTTMTFPL